MRKIHINLYEKILVLIFQNQNWMFKIFNSILLIKSTKENLYTYILYEIPSVDGSTSPPPPDVDLDLGGIRVYKT